MINSDAGKMLIWLIVIVMAVLALVLLADKYGAFSLSEFLQAIKSDKYLSIATTGLLTVAVFIVSWVVLKTLKRKES